MKRVLITGGTGFIGANLCRRLLTEGHEVHCLVRNNFTHWRIDDIKKHIQLYTVDLSNLDDLQPIIAKVRPEWIFHLATHGAYSWQTDLNEIIHTNILATVNLVEACLKTDFEIFINTGSSSEYGYKNHAPLETERIDPNSYYAVSKAFATLFCRHTAIRYKVCIPTLRLYSVYGPFENPGRLIPTIILHGMQGSLPALVTPNTARDYIYIKDMENAYMLLANHLKGSKGDIYNLGSGVQTSIREVVNIARKIFKIKIKPQWGTMPNREWDTSIWVANCSSLKSEGWGLTYSFLQGFRETVDWFQNCTHLLKHYKNTSLNV
jgi:nucleoside-diphosphate-sugar epimerase